VTRTPESQRKADELSERLEFLEDAIDAHSEAETREFNSIKENVAVLTAASKAGVQIQRRQVQKTE